MAYNKSTVGVLVYLYISFIAIVGLLALIQSSHGAEAIDGVHVNELPKDEQKEKDEHSLPLSLSHDLQNGNREQQKNENENSYSNSNNNINKQYQQQHEQVNHEKDLMSQQGHPLQEPPSTGDADVLQEQEKEGKEGSNSPANESSLTMVAKQQQQQHQEQQEQQQQPSAFKSVRVECKMLPESGDEVSQRLYFIEFHLASSFVLFIL